MEYPLVTVILLLAYALTSSLADVSSLQDNTQEHLDPLQDQDQDPITNNQDKRTICAALNSCGGRSNGAYVKRVVIKGGLKPHALGYAPIRVGIKPTLLGGYRYSRPKIHYSLKAPSVAAQTAWKPVQAVVKPVVEVKPGQDVIHNTPEGPHVDHVGPTNLGHVHLQPLRPSFVHLRPGHVDQVHQVNVPHGNHFDSFTHLDHVAPVPQPIVPSVVRPFAPSPTLFEVTRPNLGVLPLGSRFLTPVWKQAPHVHLAPALPVAPPAPVVPHPSVSVEYHGTRNYLPLPGAVPLYQPNPLVNPVLPFEQPLPFQHAAHGGFVPQQPLPFPHAAHGGFVPQQPLPFPHAAHGGFAPQQPLPFQHAAHGFAVPQQTLPHDHPTQFFAPEQQLPHSGSPHFQQQLQAIQQYQEIPQGQLPLEGEQQTSIDQYIQNNQDAFAANLDQSNVIQPGQTDLQIPYHLPQHGGWNGVQQLQQDAAGFGQQVFRPSQQLEAPYKK